MPRKRRRENEHWHRRRVHVTVVPNLQSTQYTIHRKVLNFLRKVLIAKIVTHIQTHTLELMHKIYYTIEIVNIKCCKLYPFSIGHPKKSHFPLSNISLLKKLDTVVYALNHTQVYSLQRNRLLNFRYAI